LMVLGEGKAAQIKYRTAAALAAKRTVKFHVVPSTGVKPKKTEEYVRLSLTAPSEEQGGKMVNQKLRASYGAIKKRDLGRRRASKFGRSSDKISSQRRINDLISGLNQPGNSKGPTKINY